MKSSAARESLPRSKAVPAVILAGGRSARMGGGDKCWLQIGGASILSRIVSVLSSQVGTILINSNSDTALFDAFGLGVRPDVMPGHLGPLAGILTAMEWAQEIDDALVLTVPSDTPFLPHDLVARLYAKFDGVRPVVASSGARIHPTIGLWPTLLAQRLRNDLQRGVRKAHTWLVDTSCAVAEFAFESSDPFSNINTQKEWQQANARVQMCECGTR
jgi:molybdenum cofactor guanylyltransferase